MKILVSVFSNLGTDQRVEKVCRTLHDQGFEIMLIGNDWNGLPLIERPYAFKRLQLNSKVLRYAYGEFNWKLYHELLKNADKDTILLSNDLDSLLPNYLVSKKLGIPLVFDSHEIYTEMPSIQGRWVQHIWRLLERRIVPRLKYMMTASESYADWFVKTYKIPKPVTVQNFPRKTTQPTYIPHEKKILIYQGAINPSRGLDKLIPVMKRIDNAELWIAGEGPRKEEYIRLTKNLVLEDTVKFLGNIPPEKLREITARADVGFSIEENNGLSYYYSLPNKIADYIQARVPVITTDFPEPDKIIKKFGVGVSIKNHTEEELCAKITEVLHKGRQAYLDELETASHRLCWENEVPKLIQVFERVVKENFNK